MSLDKRLRDHRDTHRSAFEAPVSLPALQGRVIGWQDGAYLIQEGADRRIKQAATNGAIATGSVMAVRGRLDGQGTRKAPTQDNVLFLPQREGGVVMWLDVNWYDLGYINSPPDKVAAATRFLDGLLDYFFKGKTKVLYTLPSTDSRNSVENEFTLFRQIVADKNIAIVEANPLDASGVYFAPLLGRSHENPFWTIAELAALKRLAKKYGCLCDGEWIGWTENDEALLRGLGVRSDVRVLYSDAVRGSHDVHNPKLFREPFQINCAATAFFEGLNLKEIVATVNGRPTIAYFRSSDLKS